MQCLEAELAASQSTLKQQAQQALFLEGELAASARTLQQKAQEQRFLEQKLEDTKTKLQLRYSLENTQLFLVLSHQVVV